MGVGIIIITILGFTFMEGIRINGNMHHEKE